MLGAKSATGHLVDNAELALTSDCDPAQWQDPCDILHFTVLAGSQPSEERILFVEAQAWRELLSRSLRRTLTCSSIVQCRKRRGCLVVQIGVDAVWVRICGIVRAWRTFAVLRMWREGTAIA